MIVSAGTSQGYSQVHSGTEVQKGRLSGAVLTQLGLDLEGQHDPPQNVEPQTWIQVWALPLTTAS